MDCALAAPGWAVNVTPMVCKPDIELRRGRTTGACASSTMKAALMRLQGLDAPGAGDVVALDRAGPVFARVGR